MDPQLPPPTPYRNISEAATVLALGGRFIRQSVDRSNILVFEIVPPDGIDLNDPDLMVPVPSMLAWSETLATRVRDFNRHRAGGNR